MKIGLLIRCERIVGRVERPCQDGVIRRQLSTLSDINLLTILPIRLIGGKMYKFFSQENENALTRNEKGSNFQDTYFGNLAVRREANKSVSRLKGNRDVINSNEEAFKEISSFSEGLREKKSASVFSFPGT